MLNCIMESGAMQATGFLVSFVLTVLLMPIFKKLLPKDQGRKYAVEGTLSEGKTRGAGLVFVTVFTIMHFLFVMPTLENIFYLVLIYASMLTGFFDDAAEKPWDGLKKGILDFVIAAGITAAFIINNGTTVSLALFEGFEFTIPVPIFAVLSVILVWGIINTTNCTDGVDGLSATLAIITILSFTVLNSMRGFDLMNYSSYLFIACLLAYLLFNANPSTVLMGDAGSRAMGTFIAILALKSGDPFMILIFAIVIILDGGLGILKLSLIRYLKLKNFMKSVRTPLHDHTRKEIGWSGTQTVFRFAIIQFVISATVLWFIY